MNKESIERTKARIKYKLKRHPDIVTYRLDFDRQIMDIRNAWRPYHTSAPIFTTEEIPEKVKIKWPWWW